MRAYWAEGHNQSYILLRIMVERRQLIATMQQHEQLAATSQERLEEETFCKSFENRAKKIWSTLMGPYRRDDEDVNDFITDEIDDAEDGEEQTQRPVFEKPESDLEDQFIQHLRKKRMSKKHGFDSSSSEGEGSS